MKLFVWDFHGVLEKGNEDAVVHITNSILEKFKFKERLSLEQCRAWYGLKWFQFFENLLPHESYEKHLSLQEACATLGLSQPAIISQHIQPNDNAHEVLEAISKKHHQIIISNVRQRSLDLFMHAINVAKYFEGCAFAASDPEHSFKKSKSDFLADFLRNKTFDDIVIIGDSAHDMDMVKVRGGVTYLYAYPGRPHKDCDADYKIHDLRKVLREV